LTPTVDGTDEALDPLRIRISENEAKPGSRVAVTQGTWKVVFVRGDPDSVQLFDRSRDPGELINVVDEHPARVAALVQHYREWRAEHEALRALFPHGAPGTQELDAETLRELRALGYIQ
jgi:arylsulfatase A-like enzyme